MSCQSHISTRQMCVIWLRSQLRLCLVVTSNNCRAFDPKFSPWAEHANGHSGPPNIVFIMADDLGYGDLGCYGQQQIQTPCIDRLALEGMRFTQAYAGGCVCTPSRSCLMTGTHGGHTPARDNIPHYRTYLQESDVTLAEVLQQAGYRCGE